MPELWRIDPYGCACTDCIVGKSKPLENCDNEDLLRMLRGDLVNATDFNNAEFVVELSIKRPPRPNYQDS